MIHSEPLDETAEKKADAADKMTSEHAIPVAIPGDTDADTAIAEDASHDLAGAPQTVTGYDNPDQDSLDSDVQNLLYALADEENRRDDAWVETVQKIDIPAQDDPDRNAMEHLVELDDALLPASPTTEENRHKTDTLIDEAPSATVSGDPDDAESSSEDPALVSDPELTDTDRQEQTSTMLGLQAINALDEKMTASEARYDGAMAKMGHALGVIAQRIDSLESRLTDQTISNVALAAAPPEVEDHSVAPYIARAERELKAQNGSGSMDIFDRIARAAETEFDDQAPSATTRVIDNASDGRRVGTKKWQPSKTVKRRMEKLEKARTEVDEAEAPAPERAKPAARKLRTDLGPVPDETTPDTLPEDADMSANPRQDTMADPVFDLQEEDDDDSGLSVVPGARGRRRNRARKSQLDEDFENVFAEGEDKPSIQTLRRKMRQRPTDEQDSDTEKKSGRLSGIIGKKSAKKAKPAEVEIEDEDDDLTAAFDAEEETGQAPKSSKKNKAIAINEADDDEWDDDDAPVRSGRRPVLYMLIAGLAAAGFFAWKTLIG